jgi:hypothetical protein
MAESHFAELKKTDIYVPTSIGPSFCRKDTLPKMEYKNIGPLKMADRHFAELKKRHKHVLDRHFVEKTL